MLDSLANNEGQCKNGDLFFYSGHGYPSSDGGRLYFLPWDSDIDYLKDTAISQSLIFKSLQQANPKTSLCLLTVVTVEGVEQAKRYWLVSVL